MARVSLKPESAHASWVLEPPPHQVICKQTKDEKHFYTVFTNFSGFSLVQKKKNPPAIQEMWDQEDPLGQEDPLEEEMETHSSILAWETPRTEEPGGLQSMGSPKSWTRLSDFTFTFHFHAMREEMATHSSVLAWRIPGTAEPGGLPSMGSQILTRLKRLSSNSSLKLSVRPSPTLSSPLATTSLFSMSVDLFLFHKS